MTARAKVVADFDGRFMGIRIYCPCGMWHDLAIKGWRPDGMEDSPTPSTQHRWTFNGNFERPTFKPSINSSYGHVVDGTPPEQCYLCANARERGEETLCGRCHTWVTDGRVAFCGDSTRHAGKTIDLREVPADA